MNNQDEQIKLRQQLALYTDQFITLSDNPAWVEMIAQHPELETARRTAAEASDFLWWQYRTRLVTRDDND